MVVLRRFLVAFLQRIGENQCLSQQGQQRGGMKVLIRAIDDGRFLTRSGTWTVEISAAQDFASFVPAANFCREQKLGRVELFYCFEDSHYNFALNVPSSAGRLQTP